MGQQNEIFEELIDLIKKHDFTYLILDNLEIWKKSVNSEYLIKKKLKQVMDHFGHEHYIRVKKAILKEIKNDMIYKSVIPNQVDSWFLPYMHIEMIKQHESTITHSSYKLTHHNKLKHSEKVDKRD